MSQQRRAVTRNTVPKRKRSEESTIQLLSAVLGSAGRLAIAAVALGTEGADVVVLTVVTVVVVVLVAIAAGFTAGPAAGVAPGCSTAGSAPVLDSRIPSPGTSRESVSPAGKVSLSGLDSQLHPNTSHIHPYMYG